MAQMYYGTGRRKSSVARVRLIPGTGNVTVNGKALDVYFPMEIVKREVLRPFEVAGCEGKFDVIAKVEGGGFTGQAGALRHGVSRALCEADIENRPALKAAGFLTRDSRMKERNTVSKKREELPSSPRDNWIATIANHIRVENPRQIPTLGIVRGYFYFCGGGFWLQS